MIILFNVAGSDTGKRQQNPDLKQEFICNAELLSLQAFIHVSVL